MSNPKKRICVLSGRYPHTSFNSFVNHKVYCSKHNYTYISCAWPSKAENRYMNKIMYIKEYYHLFDYIFWIDDDAFFINLDQKIESFLPSESEFLSICSSPTFRKLKTFFSSGQFLLKCNEVGKNFIDSILNVSLSEVEAWWTDDYGFFSNGDQDAMVYLCETQASFKSGIRKWNYQCFNSRIENLDGIDVHDVFILHITGTRKAKKKKYRRAQKLLGTNSSLLDKRDQVGWNLHPVGVFSKLRNTFARMKKVFLK